MAVRSKQKYDPDKIEKLAEHVRIYHESGDPIEYEILIDRFKAVRRTSDPQMFALYENFIGADTKVLEINFYHSNSNTYDKYIFTLEDEVQGQLNGIEVEQRVQESVQRERKEWEYDQIRQENERLKKEVTELEEEVESLEKEKEELLNSRSPLEGVLGEFGSSLLESFIRRNPKIIAGLPGGQALAGIIEEDNQRQAHEAQLPESQVSFRPKSEGYNQEEKAAIEFVNQLKTQFTKEEFDQVMIILQTLANDKGKIELILNHVNIKNQDHE